MLYEKIPVKPDLLNSMNNQVVFVNIENKSPSKG